MPRHVVIVRPAWEDRFRRPAAADLLAGFNKQLTQLIEFARTKFLSLDGVSEEVAWLGIPWRWAFAYTSCAGDARSVGYLIPQPGRPQIALPLSNDLIMTLPPKRLSKFVRDGLLPAVQVNGVRWAQWDVTTRPQVDELIHIVTLRSRGQTAAATA